MSEAADRAIAAVETDRVVDIARRICATPSPPGDEGPCAEVIASILERPGVDVHFEEVVPGRPNVIATVTGAGTRPPLVLNGHIDATVHPGAWRQDPYQPWVEDGRMYAGGITDMKGALSAMVAAVESAATLGGLPGDLILQAVMHHDTIGLGAKYTFASEGPSEGYGICGEPSDLAIHTANGGAAKFEVMVRGETAHISRQALGHDALSGAVEIYNALGALRIDHDPCERLPDLPRMQIGELHAGSAPGAVADHAVIRGDVRTVPGMNRHVVRTAIEECVAAAAPPDLDIRVRITAVQRPFLGATSGVLVDAIADAHRRSRGSEVRITNELPGQSFVTDAADMAANGLEAVVYGVGAWHHAPDQSVAIDDLVDSARVYLAAGLAPLR